MGFFAYWYLVNAFTMYRPGYLTKCIVMSHFLILLTSKEWESSHLVCIGKNEVRKKYSCLHKVKIPCNAVSILKVSVPLDKLSVPVSVPLFLYLDAPLPSLAVLQKRIIDGHILPNGIYVHLHG